MAHLAVGQKCSKHQTRPLLLDAMWWRVRFDRTSSRLGKNDGLAEAVFPRRGTHHVVFLWAEMCFFGGGKKRIRAGKNLFILKSSYGWYKMFLFKVKNTDWEMLPEIQGTNWSRRLSLMQNCGTKTCCSCVKQALGCPRKLINGR